MSVTRVNNASTEWHKDQKLPHANVYHYLTSHHIMHKMVQGCPKRLNVATITPAHKNYTPVGLYCESSIINYARATACPIPENSFRLFKNEVNFYVTHVSLSKSPFRA